MKLQKLPRPGALLPFSIHLERATLYQSQPMGAPLEVSCSPPALELSTDVMHTLWSLGTKLTEFRLHGFLLAHRAKLTKNTLQVNDVQWHSSAKPLFGGQFSIPLRYCGALEVFDLLNELGEKTRAALRAGHKDPVQSLDLLQLECYLTSDPHKISLHFLRVWPSISLSFQPISPLRIVSTDLAIRLIKEKKEDSKVRSGYMTMDKSKRLVLLRSHDPHLPEVPLVGIWLSGLSKGRPETYSQLLWSSCVQYLLSSFPQRLSNAPQCSAFLVLTTSAPVTCYEVTVQDEDRSGWQSTMASVTITGTEPGDMTVPLRFGEVLRNSVCSEASTRASEDSSHKLQNSAEDLIKEQTLVLRDLERQLTELKKQVFTTAAPQTARSRGEKGRMSVEEITGIGACTERRYAVTRMQSPRHSPRYSLPVSRRSPPRTSVIPRIEYRSESDTSEDSELRQRR